MKIRPLGNNIDSQRPSGADPVMFDTVATGFDKPPKKPNQNKNISYVIHIEPQKSFNSTSLSADATPRRLVGKNEKRVYLMIQNVGVNPCYVAFGKSVGTNGSSGIELNAGFEYVAEYSVPNNDMSIVSPLGTNIVIVEGSRIE